MTIKFLFIMISCCVWWAGCRDAPDDHDSIMSAFADYLHSDIGLEIPRVRHYWFLVPATGCSGCSMFMADVYGNLPEAVKGTKATMILSRTARMVLGIDSSKGCRVDNADKLDRLAIAADGAVLLVTENGESTLKLAADEQSSPLIRQIVDSLKAVAVED